MNQLTGKSICSFTILNLVDNLSESILVNTETLRLAEVDISELVQLVHVLLDHHSQLMRSRLWCCTSLLFGMLGWLDALASGASFALEWLFPTIGAYCLVARPLSLAFLWDFGIVSIIRNSVGTFSNKSMEKGQWGTMLCIKWPIFAQNCEYGKKNSYFSPSAHSRTGKGIQRSEALMSSSSLSVAAKRRHLSSRSGFIMATCIYSPSISKARAAANRCSMAEDVPSQPWKFSRSHESRHR